MVKKCFTLKLYFKPQSKNHKIRIFRKRILAKNRREKNNCVNFFAVKFWKILKLEPFKRRWWRYLSLQTQWLQFSRRYHWIYILTNFFGREMASWYILGIGESLVKKENLLILQLYIHVSVSFTLINCQMGSQIIECENGKYRTYALPLLSWNTIPNGPLLAINCLEYWEPVLLIACQIVVTK